MKLFLLGASLLILSGMATPEQKPLGFEVRALNPSALRLERNPKHYHHVSKRKHKKENRK